MGDAPKSVWLLIVNDDVSQGEWFSAQRQASLKATWLRQKKAATVLVTKATIELGSGPRSTRRP